VLHARRAGDCPAASLRPRLTTRR